MISTEDAVGSAIDCRPKHGHISLFCTGHRPTVGPTGGLIDRINCLGHGSYSVPRSSVYNEMTIVIIIIIIIIIIIMLS